MTLLKNHSVGNEHSVFPSKHSLVVWQLRRWQSNAISVAIEQDTCVLPRGALDWLDPLASPHGRPHTLQESKTSSSGIATVVASHNRLDRLGGLVCMVEWDRADI